MFTRTFKYEHYDYEYDELGKSAFCFDAPNSWKSLQHALGLENIRSFADFKNLEGRVKRRRCHCRRRCTATALRLSAIAMDDGLKV